MSYAYTTALARLYKSQILTTGTVNELLESSNWRDAVSLLREKGLISETPKTITEFQVYMKNRALQIISTVRNYTLPYKVVSSILDLYKYIIEIDDLETAISATLTKSSGFQVYFLKEFSEFRPQSLEDIMSTLKGIEKEGLKFALERASVKTSSVINTYLEYYFIYKLSNIIETLKGDWITKAKEIICGYIDYYSALLAYKLHEQLPYACKMSKELIRDLANANSDKEAIEILSRSPYGKRISSTDVYYAFNTLKRIARVDARKASLNAFMGSPFTPVTVMALAELVRLDTEDIITIVNGLALIRDNKDRQKVLEDIKSLLSFELI